MVTGKWQKYQGPCYYSGVSLGFSIDSPSLYYTQGEAENVGTDVGTYIMGDIVFDCFPLLFIWSGVRQKHLWLGYNGCFKERESTVWSFWSLVFIEQIWEDCWALLSAHLKCVVIILKGDSPNSKWAPFLVHYYKIIFPRCVQTEDRIG